MFPFHRNSDIHATWGQENKQLVAVGTEPHANNTKVKCK